MIARSTVARCLTVLCLLGAATSLRSDAATDAKDQDQTLSGTEGVFVLPAVQGAAAEQGVTADWAGTVAELRLRRNGVRVLSRDEWQKAPGLPALSVSVHLVPCTTVRGLYAESIETSLIQVVVLDRDARVKIGAKTWETGSTGTVGLSRIKEGVKDELEDQVDKFSNAFLAQNPKK